MAIQYSDTTFSENMPLKEAMEKFNECLITGTPVQALHVGTISELNARKMEIMRRADLQTQVDELRNRIEQVEEQPEAPCES